MVKTVESRLTKLENKRAAGTEPVMFKVFTIEALPDGVYLRRNLKTHKGLKVTAAFLGITPYTPPVAHEATAASPALPGSLPVPPAAAQPVQAPVESEFEKLRRQARLQDAPLPEPIQWSYEGIIKVTDKNGTWYP